MKKIQSFSDLIGEFDGFLFDAFGVLVDETKTLKGAIQTINMLKRLKKPYLMLSNGSSKTVSQTAGHYRAMGLDFADDQVLTSGSLLIDFLKANAEQSEQIAVMGTAGSFELVTQAGCAPVSVLDGSGNFRYLVIANQTDYPLLATLDEALSQICIKLDSGKPLKVILTNPDLFYPKGNGLLGITAGSVAGVLESSIYKRYGKVPDNLFHPLGKPFSPMFEKAIKIMASHRLLMVGDQIFTDIQGGINAGLGTLLVGSGLTHLSSLGNFPPEMMPQFYIESL